MNPTDEHLAPNVGANIDQLLRTRSELDEQRRHIQAKIDQLLTSPMQRAQAVKTLHDSVVSCGDVESPLKINWDVRQ